jgi:hypothetical protein
MTGKEKNSPGLHLGQFAIAHSRLVKPSSKPACWHTTLAPRKIQIGQINFHHDLSGTFVTDKSWPFVVSHEH